ncbi:MAG: hypothetical protein KME57_32880 [Scytonema hyalinum WJT4-NPBG1]|nr:hypothetical protein [Scytonema hyalinum WJT4-NPBG1]
MQYNLGLSDGIDARLKLRAGNPLPTPQNIYFIRVRSAIIQYGSVKDKVGWVALRLTQQAIAW